MKRIFLGAALLLGGCASTPPPRDPFLGGPVPTPYKDLTLGLMISENTRKSLDWLRTGQKALRVQGESLDPEQVMSTVVETLQRDFKKVMRAERLQDAVAAGADLVAVLDTKPLVLKRDFRYVPILLPPHGLLFLWMDPRVAVVDYTMTFLAPDGRQVGVVRAAKQQRRRYASLGRHVREAYDQARYDLEEALFASEPLRRYAETARAKGSAAAAELVKSDVDEPAYKLDVDEDSFAVVVGVEAYEQAPPALYAERDAAAVRDHLLALGYPQRNIAFLSGAAAGRAAIEKSVEGWLRERAKASSRVLVYFAGHGSPDVRTGRGFLLPADGDPRFLETTGYPLERLTAALDALPARELVVALDAGFAGHGDRSVLPQGARPLVAQAQPKASRAALLSAAGADEGAAVEPAQRHGLLTYGLLKALNARKGDARLAELHRDAARTVADLARRAGREQTPTLVNGDGVRLR